MRRCLVIVLLLIPGCFGDEPTPDQETPEAPPVAVNATYVPPATAPWLEQWLESCDVAWGAVNSSLDAAEWPQDTFAQADGRYCNTADIEGVRMHLPLWPEDWADDGRVSPPRQFWATSNGTTVDWIYWDEGDAVWILPGGQPEPEILLDSWPEMSVPGGDRTLRFVGAAPGPDGVHIIVDTAYNYPYPVPQQDRTFIHAWPGGHEFLQVDTEPEWLFDANSIAGNGSHVAATMRAYTVAGLLGQTDERRGFLLTTDGGAFDVKELAAGTMAEHVDVGDGVALCGLSGSDVMHWGGDGWARVGTTSSPGPMCGAAAVEPAAVVYAGLPLIGSGGGGEPGSPDGDEYVAATLVNGTWEHEALGRGIFRGFSVSSVQGIPFFADDTSDGTYGNELVVGPDWRVVAGFDGGDVRVVQGAGRPAMFDDGNGGRFTAGSHSVAIEWLGA